MHFSRIWNIDNEAHNLSNTFQLAEKGVLKNYAEFTGKHLCESLFFNSVYLTSNSNLENKGRLHFY